MSDKKFVQISDSSFFYLCGWIHASSNKSKLEVLFQLEILDLKMFI